MRSIKEWIGKDDDTPIPPRVKLRVRAKANDCCEAPGCGIRVRLGSGDVDHRLAICNGGENRESNLQFLCKNHHLAKTAKDVAEKSASAKTAKHLAGFKSKGRGFWKPPKRRLKDGYWHKWIDKITGRERVTYVEPEE